MKKLKKLLNLMMDKSASDGEVLSSRRILIKRLEEMNKTIIIGEPSSIRERRLIEENERLNRDNELLLAKLEKMAIDNGEIQFKYLKLKALVKTVIECFMYLGIAFITFLFIKVLFQYFI